VEPLVREQRPVRRGQRGGYARYVDHRVHLWRGRLIRHRLGLSSPERPWVTCVTGRPDCAEAHHGVTWEEVCWCGAVRRVEAYGRRRAKSAWRGQWLIDTGAEVVPVLAASYPDAADVARIVLPRIGARRARVSSLDRRGEAILVGIVEVGGDGR
jgi:hypothetical protein